MESECKGALLGAEATAGRAIMRKALTASGSIVFSSLVKTVAFGTIVQQISQFGGIIQERVLNSYSTLSCFIRNSAISLSARFSLIPIVYPNSEIFLVAKVRFLKCRRLEIVNK